MGFCVFALGYAYTIIMLAIDMKKRNKMYQDYIDDDIAKLESMGMHDRMDEIYAELAVRLSGAKDEEGADDQLITQALELKSHEFQKYM